MAGPQTPVNASFPIPPPVANFPWVQTSGPTAGLLTPMALEFLQYLWASIQGGGGLIDIIAETVPDSGQIGAIAEGLIEQDNRAALAASDLGARIAAFSATLEEIAVSTADAPVLAKLGALQSAIEDLAVALTPVSGLRPSLSVRSAGTTAENGVAILDFTGAGVSLAVNSAGIVTVTIAGGAGGTVTSVASATGDLTVSTPSPNPVLTVVSAPKWTTGRTLSLTGDVTYTSPSLDGSGNVTAAATIANSVVTLAKIANAAASSKLLGSGASGSGAAYSELDLGNYLSMTGTTVNVIPPLVVGFILTSGATGTNVGPELCAPRAGSVTKCKVVTKASDASTDLSFRIKQNGTDVFSSDPTVTHGTSGGTVSTFTSLTSSPLAIAADDVFTLDVLTGTASWQATIQLE